ncbi:hypothetical protein ACIG0D_22480 [Streptomyces sp. NPDC052773]|uniref:nSTAND1 domain-containing NTPase n=1 Tax=Streptomyces sp. NPDC052773 TaxID=3365693 RepID=UPI0037D69873
MTTKSTAAEHGCRSLLRLGRCGSGAGCEEGIPARASPPARRAALSVVCRAAARRADPRQPLPRRPRRTVRLCDLPLLSDALLETWHRRRGNALTLAGFQAAGGLEGGLAQTAEAFYVGLSETQQHLTRRLLTRLVALGEGTEDTKRRVARRELDDAAYTVLVLEQATRARLLTVDRDHVELTHEALIRCWPRLGGWLAEDRDQPRLRRALTEATAVWESLGRDPDTLHRGCASPP